MDALAAYPAQEPLSALGAAYSARVLALGAGIRGEDISYGDHAHQALTIFRPEHPSGIVLVVFHGGGWTNGYKEWMSFMAPALNGQGITLVSATYRLAPEHVFPAGFDDCADAIACRLMRHPTTTSAFIMSPIYSQRGKRRMAGSCRYVAEGQRQRDLLDSINLAGRAA